MWNSVRQRKQAPNIGPKPTPTTRPFPLISNLQPMGAHKGMEYCKTEDHRHSTNLTAKITGTMHMPPFLTIFLSFRTIYVSTASYCAPVLNLFMPFFPFSYRKNDELNPSCICIFCRDCFFFKEQPGRNSPTNLSLHRG